MCGILGFISPSVTRKQFEVATDKLVSRGPDDSGYYYQPPVGLGHRRLSVIDLNKGDQPMLSKDGEHVLIYNGEIYNFKKLWEELKSLGAGFQTESDTEVLLKGYLQWGLDKLLEKIEGMFAFALWDNSINRLFLVRDLYGEKPLYYTSNKQGFYFASELKALDSYYNSDSISKIGLNLFFSLSYIPAPHTIYEGVYKLEPGHYLSVGIDKSVSHHCYYDLKAVVKNGRNNLVPDYKYAQKRLKELLFASVEERMISDVPLGAFLSGGIDSSIISAIMSKVSSDPIKTFSIGFKEKAYDESERAALVARNIKSDHTLHILDHYDLLDVVDETLSYFDEPFGDSSAIPSMMVARKAKEKVTVVLTGDCADELFGGYEKYLGKYYVEKYKAYPKLIRSLFEAGISVIPHTPITNHILRKVKKVIRSADFTNELRYLQLASLGYDQLEINTLLKKDFSIDTEEIILSHYRDLNELDEFTQTFYSDVKLVLEGDMLTKVDRACMMNSLEGRIPFLDSNIVDFSFRLPHHFKIQGTNKKRILKDTFRELLPEETLNFSKKGFGIPLHTWFRNELKDELVALLDDDNIKAQGIFNPSYISRLLSEHFKRKENHASKLWLLFVFQKWYKKTVLEA